MAILFIRYVYKINFKRYTVSQNISEQGEMMKQNSLKKNIIFNVLLSMSNILFPMITFPYLSRVLGPEYYGTVNFALSIVAYFILVTEFGIPLYGTREISKVQNDIKRKSIIFCELFVVPAVEVKELETV